MNEGQMMNASVDYLPVPGVASARSDGGQSLSVGGGFVDVRLLQTCPVCGRRLRVRVEYLGTRVCCRHCRGTFTARDNSASEGDAAGERGYILERANRWLAVPASS
jgi:hypothetical protein